MTGLLDEVPGESAGRKGKLGEAGTAELPVAAKLDPAEGGGLSNGNDETKFGTEHVSFCASCSRNSASWTANSMASALVSGKTSSKDIRAAGGIACSAARTS